MKTKLLIFLIVFVFFFRFDLVLQYTPDKFLGFVELMGSVPIPGTKYNIGMGQLYNFFALFFVIFYLFQIRKNMMYYKNGLFRKNATYLLSGKTGKGKTRLLTQIARDCKSDNTIIASNFFHGYDELFYSSFKDFCLLQIDISLLGEQFNFDEKEKKIISKYFPKYFAIVDKEIAKKIKKIKGKYHFVTLGDEFYGYLHNRSAMSNFSKKEGKTLLMNLHQTRHSNQTLILASQDSDNLDLDLRQLAHNEIEVKSWILDIFYGFNVYTYLTKKEIQKMGIEFKKNNIFPYFFFNAYLVYSFLNKFFVQYQKILIFLIRKRRKNYDKEIKNMKFLSDEVLDFNTKFNVKINIDSYNSGDLFDYLIEKEQKKLTK